MRVTRMKYTSIFSGWFLFISPPHPLENVEKPVEMFNGSIKAAARQKWEEKDIDI